MTQVELYKKTQDFINDFMNKPLDTDGYPSYQKYQCVDVIRAYMAGGIKNNSVLAAKYPKGVLGMPLVPGNAVNYWYDYPYNLTLQKFFTRIPNTPTGVPRLGDIVIFAAWWRNPYGHIGIGTNAGNVFYLTTFDQNWKGPYCTYISHNYIYPRVLGWLRFKV